MSLTDDWKAGGLKPGHYYCKAKNGYISVYQILQVNEKLMRIQSGEIKEVLAPCDYEELQLLKKENDDLSALITSGQLEIGHLRHLLKECKPLFFPYVKDMPLSKHKTLKLLTHVNAAIGESEE